MEFVLELLFEIIIEGTIELGTNKKVPMTIRVISAILFSLIFLVLITGIIIMGIEVWNEMNKLIGAIVVSVAVLLVIMLVYAVKKYITKLNNSNK